MDFFAENRSPLHRIVMIGDSAVGKTSMITKLVNDEFKPDEESTVGAMFIMHEEIVNGKKIEMQIWDTAGQERFRSLGPIYYRGAHCAVAVFDITRNNTFIGLEPWVESFKDIAGQASSVFIVGNKIDLVEYKDVVDDSVNKWCENRGLKYYPTSALTGSGINELFQDIALYLLQNENNSSAFDANEAIDIEPKNNEGESSCC